MEYRFLVEATEIENTSFPFRTALSEANVKTNRMATTKWTYHKEWIFASNYFKWISGGMSKFMSDTTNIKIKYKLPKSYVQLVYDEKVSRHLENCHSNRAIT